MFEGTVQAETSIVTAHVMAYPLVPIDVRHCGMAWFIGHARLGTSGLWSRLRPRRLWSRWGRAMRRNVASIAARASAFLLRVSANQGD